jgi:hypothetical protein
MRPATLKLKIGFRPNNKETQRLMEMVKALKIHITTIHDDVGTWLRNDLVQHVNVTDFAVGDIDKHGNRTLQIHHGVKFHGALGATELGPREQRQTQIDSRRV